MSKNDPTAPATTPKDPKPTRIAPSLLLLRVRFGLTRADVRKNKIKIRALNNKYVERVHPGYEPIARVKKEYTRGVNQSKTTGQVRMEDGSGMASLADILRSVDGDQRIGAATSIRVMCIQHESNKLHAHHYK
eukprot:5411310-Pyramimonas_sp.AAC.1